MCPRAGRSGFCAAAGLIGEGDDSVSDRGAALVWGNDPVKDPGVRLRSSRGTWAWSILGRWFVRTASECPMGSDRFLDYSSSA